VTVFLQVDPESGKGCTAGITSGNRWIKYKVQPGDTLTAIARCFDLNGYQAVYQQNEKLIGDNPNLIFPGQVFTIVNGVMTASEPSA
jgi:LysM repeat protein